MPNCFDWTFFVRAESNGLLSPRIDSRLQLSALLRQAAFLQEDLAADSAAALQDLSASAVPPPGRSDGARFADVTSAP
jgi:hypothetical protein